MSTSADTAARGTASVSPEEPPRSVFVTTHWSVVLTAGRRDTRRARSALENLCQTYWQPLYAYVRHQGHPPHDAQDLTQEFFARLLERNAVAKADPQRGRFRSFLLASLKHFLANEWDKSHALKRGSGARPVSLPFDTAEDHLPLPAAPGDAPDAAFDRQWALALLDVVLARLRREYADAGKDDLFVGLKDTLSGGRSEIPYRDLALRLRMSEGAVRVAAHRLRKQYRELLRQEIANTVANEEDVEEELRHLFAALST